MPDMLTLQTVLPNHPWLMVIYTILLSFLLSSSVALTYVKTFKGLSYSRNYVQALTLSAIVAATVMRAVGDSLAHGLGMIGALAIIRFRTNFKDSKDILFIFAALAAGIGCGVGAFNVAVAGTIGFIMAAFLLHFIPFGQASYFDGMLRFNIENSDENKGEIEKILTEFCQTFALITLRDMNQGRRLDYAYHIKLKNKSADGSIIEALPQRIPSVRGVSLMLQETTIDL